MCCHCDRSVAVQDATHVERLCIAIRGHTGLGCSLPCPRFMVPGRHALINLELHQLAQGARLFFFLIEHFRPLDTSSGSNRTARQYSCTLCARTPCHRYGHIHDLKTHTLLQTNVLLSLTARSLTGICEDVHTSLSDDISD